MRMVLDVAEAAEYDLPLVVLKLSPICPWLHSIHSKVVSVCVHFVLQQHDD